MTGHQSGRRAPRLWRPRHRTRGVLAAVALLVATLGGVAVPAAAQQPHSVAAGPGRYYMSLGDSFGFGIQLKRFFAMVNDGTYKPEAFDTGYTDDLAAMMRVLRPHLGVVNYSCPGASVHQMRATDCGFARDFALHDAFNGAQLDAAVTFLHAHPGRVSPITVSIGGIDMLNTFYACNGDPTCIHDSALARHLHRGLSIVLRRLRLAAPTAQIVLLLPLDAALRDYPSDDPLWAGYLALMRTVAAGAHVKVADSYNAITASGKTCDYTFFCDDTLPDFHPNDAGYALIATLIFHAAGYDQLNR